MKLMFSLIVYLIITSCRTQSIHYDCGSRLKSDLNINWKFNADSSFHLFNEGLTLRMDTSYKQCLIGLTVKEIENLFGQPNDTSEFNHFVLKYNLSPPCTNTYFSCDYLLFEFNGDRTVKRFGVLFRERGFPN